jgi:hypothetical protein
MTFFFFELPYLSGTAFFDCILPHRVFLRINEITSGKPLERKH